MLIFGLCVVLYIFKLSAGTEVGTVIVLFFYFASLLLLERKEPDNDDTVTKEKEWDLKDVVFVEDKQNTSSGVVIKVAHCNIFTFISCQL